LVSWLAVW